MEQMPEEKGFDPEPPKEKRDIVPHLTLPVEATNVDENRPLTTGIRRSISNLRRESMNDLNSTRRAQLTLYDEFMDAKTPRDWLQRSERQKNKDMSNLAEVYARKDLERIAKKLDSIDRQLISAVSDSKERAHIARAKFERREKHIEKELEIRRRARQILADKEKGFRDYMYEQHIPPLEKELAKIKSASDKYSSRTHEALRHSWRKSLEWRIHIEIEKKKQDEWSTERLIAEAKRQLAEEKDREKRKTDDMETKRYTALLLHRLQGRLDQPNPSGNSTSYNPARDAVSPLGNRTRMNSLQSPTSNPSNIPLTASSPLPPQSALSAAGGTHAPTRDLDPSRPSSSLGPRGLRLAGAVQSLKELDRQTSQPLLSHPKPPSQTSQSHTDLAADYAAGTSQVM